MAEKETSLEKIKRLTSNQKNIRNIATSAHIHHGKCVSGNSRLMITNGKIKTAKEIFEEAAKDGEIYEEDEIHTVFIPKTKIEIFSLNKKTGGIEKKPLQYAWRLQGGKTIKITLRNGFEITTTPEHKYVVLREGFEDVEAKDIKLGDRIVCPRKIKHIGNLNMKECILNKLSQKNFYVKLKKEFAKAFKHRILKHGLKNINTGIKSKSFYHGIWQNRYPLKELLEIARLFNIGFEEMYDAVDVIYFRT